MTDLTTHGRRQAYVTSLVEKRAAEKHARKLRKRAYLNEWRARNPKAGHKATAAWRARNPDKVKVYERRSQLRKKFGIELEERDAMLAAQGGVCAICSTDTPGRTDWHTDHNTGKLRGILCHRCNTGIGLLNDNTATLKSAIKYLERHHG